MIESLGAYTSYSELEHEIVLTYWPSRYALRWSQCGKIPDFVATYLVSDESHAVPPAAADVRTAVSYLLNELVENCVKFYRAGSIRIRVGKHDDELVLVVTNQVSRDEKPALLQKFSELLESDPEELFVARMEAAESTEVVDEAEERAASSLGLLSMMLDYEAQLGWQFKPVDDDGSRFWMQTMVKVPYRAVAGNAIDDHDRRAR